jgi:hypothetical protein
MTIAVDGERSRKRLPAAKKALAVITDLDLPAKAGVFDGFRYKVWRADKGELTGGRVVAPVGFFVVLADAGGLKQFACDSAQCAAAPIAPVDRHYYNKSPLDTTGYRSTVTGETGTPAPMAPVGGDGWRYPRVTNLPIGGELTALFASWESASGHFCDIMQTTHCWADGSAGRFPAINSAGFSTGVPATLTSYRVIPTFVQPGYCENVSWKTGAGYIHSSGNRTPLLVEYRGIHIPTASYFGYYVDAGDVLGGKVSALALAKITDGDGDTGLGADVYQYAAHFSRVASSIKGTSLLMPSFSRCTGSAEYCNTQFADAERPEVPDADLVWKPVLWFWDTAAGHLTANFEVLGPLGYALMNGELIHYKQIEAADDLSHHYLTSILAKLFGWPCESEYTAGERDTVTFADAAGAVHSWLRCCDPDAAQNAAGLAGVGPKLGGFKFQHPEGFVRVPLAMPADVLTDATLRPQITLMTANAYYCCADNAAGEIKHLYVGSPFAEWSEAALPDGVTMYAVRVVQPGDSVAAAGFIGIGKVPAAGDTPAAHRIFLKAAGQAWVALSPLPVAAVSADAAWDVCVFGDDPLVASMMGARQHPAAVQALRPELR